MDANGFGVSTLKVSKLVDFLNPIRSYPCSLCAGHDKLLRAHHNVWLLCIECAGSSSPAVPLVEALLNWPAAGPVYHYLLLGVTDVSPWMRVRHLDNPIDGHLFPAFPLYVREILYAKVHGISSRQETYMKPITLL